MVKNIEIDGRTIGISDAGRIYGITKELKPHLYSKSGYYYVQIGGKNYLIHRLVASAFIKPLKRGDRSLQVHHINEDKSDNRVENLQILTMQEHQHLHKQIYPMIKKCE